MQGTITLGDIKIDNYVECWVRDTGAGIPPDRVEKIFEKLETSRKEGFGLGLAIVKKFVEAHEGKITVETPS